MGFAIMALLAAASGAVGLIYLLTGKDAAQMPGALLIMVAINAASILVSLILGTYNARLIAKPMSKILEAADKLALGDLSVDVEIKSTDELGRLADSFRRIISGFGECATNIQKFSEGDYASAVINVRSEEDMMNKALLNNSRNQHYVLYGIGDAAEQVSAGSNQVSDFSMALSHSTTDQASSVEELTASLEEIASQTNLNAQNAQMASEFAINAKTHADSGNTQMKDMLKAMDEINVSSSSISKIIKVIDDIAFQTNILALNAAVEAARAGQHGRGFAVVAEEVRTLAARSANAARETTDMIEGSIKKVGAGTKIANDTAKALRQIVEEVDKSVNLVSAIAVASKEQAVGIEQINLGIQQVSQIVQTNAAIAEESAAASQELFSQAALLKKTISLVKLRPRKTKGTEHTSEKKDKIMPEPKENKAPALAGAAASKPRIALSDGEFGKY